MRRRPLAALLGLIPAVFTLSSCERAPAAGIAGRPDDTVLVYVAASLTKPLAPLFQDFTRRTGITVLTESGGSLEHARKVTSLGRVPDLLVLADPEVFPQLLAPRHVAWWADFARNRMAILYTDRSRYADSISAKNWTDILTRPGVEVGRSDPAAAPVGYRTLLVMQLAERAYRQPGLAGRLLANAPSRNVRPNAAAIAALLQSGELDYVYDYASVGRSLGVHVLELPPETDLGDPADSAVYASVSVARAGSAGDSVRIRGAPILYALSVPRRAPHASAAMQLARAMLSPAGRKLMASRGIDAAMTPIVHGHAPAPIDSAVSAR